MKFPSRCRTGKRRKGFTTDEAVLSKNGRQTIEEAIWDFKGGWGEEGWSGGRKGGVGIE